jgi:Reverse transcriptase (RNA-dependent DNA polymerase)
LQAKAKAHPTLRFYSLHDKIYRRDVLAMAYQRGRANDGSAGVDGQTFEQIESAGLGAWLDGLTEELKSKTCQPQAVRRVYIPKADGKQRPLGLPTIPDRVAQMATVIVLEPIFEADLPEEQYAYRAQRSAHDARRAVPGLGNRGYRAVVEADLSGYCDTIPHHELMKSVARRVSDGARLRLLQQGLEMAVAATDERGRKRRTTVHKDRGRGPPQGAPLSPPVGQPLPETVHPGMEAARLGKAVGGAPRERRGRLGDSVPGIGPGSARADAENHERAPTDRERKEDQDLSRARRKFRLSGLHHRPLLRPTNRTRLPRHTSGPEKGETHLCRSQRRDEKVNARGKDRGTGGRAPSPTARLAPTTFVLGL